MINLWQKLVVLLAYTVSSCAGMSVFFELQDIIVTSDEGMFAAEAATYGSLYFDALHTVKEFDDLHRFVDPATGQLRAFTVFYKGRKVPTFISAYLTGKLSKAAALTQAQQLIDLQLPGITNTLKRKLCKQAAAVNFTAAEEVKYLKLVPEGVSLLQQCAANKNNRIFLFTNRSSESLQTLKETFKNVFDCFEACFISYELQQVKPHPAAYQSVFERLGIQPEQAVCIESCREYFEFIPEQTTKILFSAQNISAIQTQLRQAGVFVE